MSGRKFYRLESEPNQYHKEQLDYIYERSNSDITKAYLEDIFKLLKLYEL